MPGLYNCFSSNYNKMILIDNKETVIASPPKHRLDPKCFETVHLKTKATFQVEKLFTNGGKKKKSQ